MIDPQSRLVGLMTAACVMRNEDALHSAYRNMPDDVCDTLTASVLEFLFKNTDMQTWGWAAGHCVTTASRLYWGGEDWAIPAAPESKPAAPVSDTRKEMTRLAFRLLRGGSGGKKLIAHMRSANDQLTTPLPPDALDGLMIWCVKTFTETANAR